MRARHNLHRVWEIRSATMLPFAPQGAARQPATSRNPRPYPSGANTPHQSSKPAAARPCGTKSRDDVLTKSFHSPASPRPSLARSGGGAGLPAAAREQRAWPNCRTSDAGEALERLTLAATVDASGNGAGEVPHSTPALCPAACFRRHGRGPVSGESLRRCKGQVHQEMTAGMSAFR